MTKSFFLSSWFDWIFSESFIKNFFLTQLSINLIENMFFFNISLKWQTSEWNLENSEIIENVENNKVKTKPILYGSEMKHFKALFNHCKTSHNNCWEKGFSYSFSFLLKVSLDLRTRLKSSTGETIPF